MARKILDGLDLASQKINNVADPTSAQDAATRNWVQGNFATPAIVLGTGAAPGVATTGIRSDATLLAFDAVAPVTQAYSDAAAVGTATVAARRDHKHGMPAIPVGYGTFASKPAAGVAGRLWTPSDGYVGQYVDDGGVWRPVIDGVVGGLPPTDSNWTYQAFNSAVGTHADDAGTIIVHQNGHDTNDRLSAMWLTAVAAPWDLKVCLLHNGQIHDYTLLGILIRSASVMWDVDVIYNSTGVGWQSAARAVDYTTGVLGASGGSSLNLAVAPKWFRIKNDGTNLFYYVAYLTSPKDWVQVHTHALSTLGTIVNYGFFCNARNTSGTVALDVRLASWSVT